MVPSGNLESSDEVEEIIKSGKGSDSLEIFWWISLRTPHITQLLQVVCALHLLQSVVATRKSPVSISEVGRNRRRTPHLKKRSSSSRKVRNPANYLAFMKLKPGP